MKLQAVFKKTAVNIFNIIGDMLESVYYHRRIGDIYDPITGEVKESETNIIGDDISIYGNRIMSVTTLLDSAVAGKYIKISGVSGIQNDGFFKVLSSESNLIVVEGTLAVTMINTPVKITGSFIMFKGLFSAYDKREIDGENIKLGDVRLQFPFDFIDFEPNPGDYIYRSGAKWNVINYSVDPALAVRTIQLRV